ncbi:MAG: hypothetical protein MUF05_04430 [Candidatus Omnitrophica bacterium]|jgi:hypothetical protein|nr:hypothetical protein [Candidatus Omnitrophota bacterium]
MRFYEYFISSLPFLSFLMPTPLSYEKFLEESSRFIPEKEHKVLKSLSVSQHYLEKKYRLFEDSLRNQLVLLRAQGLGKDALKYLHTGIDDDAQLSLVASHAMRQLSILEAEIFLDKQRWEKLDELLQGHFFDLEFLIVYAHKLLILERWEKIRSADKQLLWDNLLSFN